MTFDQILNLFGRFAEEYHSVTDWDSAAAAKPLHREPLRQAIETYLRESPFPEPNFYDVASNFYYLTGNYEQTEAIVIRWRNCKGKPIEALIRHAMLHFVEWVPYEDFVRLVSEGLEREPENPPLLLMAYRGALLADDRGRRLHFAALLAAISAESEQHVTYGIESARNLMLDRAETAFHHALELNQHDMRAMACLGKCHLDRFELDQAEEWFQRSLEVAPNEFAKEALPIIARLRKGKAWTDEEKRLKKFWSRWTESELTQISAEEETRLLAECFAVNQ